MKTYLLLVALSIVSQAATAQPGFYYTSGRLLEDPVTKQEINSPYIAYYVADSLVWTLYDPAVKDGRFQAISTSYRSSVAAGYVKGAYNFQGRRMVTPENFPTAISISVHKNGKLEWIYAHNVGICASQFTWVQKLRDKMTILSGYEQKSNQNTAILLRLDKHGQETWQKRITNEKGLIVRTTAKDRIYWMTERSDTQIILYEIDQFSGDILSQQIIQDATLSNGLRRSKAFGIDDNQLIVAYLKEEDASIALRTFDLQLRSQDIISFPVTLDYGSELSIQGITKKKDDTYSIALNFSGAIAINKGEPIQAKGSTDIALYNLNSSLEPIEIEHYGDKSSSINGIYRIGQKTAITGCYEGELLVQNQQLPASKGKITNFTVFLDSYSDLNQFEGLKLHPAAAGTPLKIYPNPVRESNEVSIRHNKLLPDVPYEIKVFNTSGQLELRTSGRTKFANRLDQIEVQGFPSGIFHVFVLQQNAVIARGKLLISR